MSGDFTTGNTTVVPPVTGIQNRLPSVASNEPRNSHLGRVSTPTVPFTTSRVATCHWEFQTEISVSAWCNQTCLSLVSAWCSQIFDSYESACRLWCSWCDEQQIDPLSASVQDDVNLLASKCTEGKEYRLAVSMTLPRLESINVGQHPLVWQVMRGIFQKKPPLPWYFSSWDVCKALTHIKSLGDNASLSLNNFQKSIWYSSLLHQQSVVLNWQLMTSGSGSIIWKESKLTFLK